MERQSTRSYLVLRVEVCDNDVELVAPNGSRYDVIVKPDGRLMIALIGEQVGEGAEGTE